MDGYQFTAAIIQAIASMAWPAVVAAIAWWFRDNILGLLHRLQGQVKGLGFEFNLAEAEKQAKGVLFEAQQDAKSAVEAAKSKEGSQGTLPDVSVGETPATPLAAQSVNLTLQEMAEVVPAAVFRESMEKIRSLLLKLIRQSGRAYDGPPSPGSMVMFLSQHGIIGANTETLVNQLSTLEVVAQFEHPTQEQAERFLGIAGAVQQALDRARINLQLREYRVARQEGRAL